MIVCPDCVVRVSCEEDIVRIFTAAREQDFTVIPVGGGTNVTSATNPGRARTVMVDLRGMDRVVWVNREDNLAYVEAGITGVRLQKELAKHEVNAGTRRWYYCDVSMMVESTRVISNLM